MYFLLILLLILNFSLFSINVLLPSATDMSNIPLTEPGVATLELVTNIEPGVYSSSVGIASSCYTLGPYSSEQVAQLVMAKIRKYGLAVQMRSLQTMETLNYLVYIPPLPTLVAAQKVTQDMANYDVQEHLVINDGPYKNAISLGFFDDLNKAMRHAEYIRYLGYDARYTEQKAPRAVFWLDYDEPFGANTPVGLWSASIDNTARVQLIPRACQN